MAYGPVFFNGDYALLQVTAYSKVPGQVIQGAELEVLVNPPAYPNSFTGTINYQDPTTETVTVTTGADGTANLIFRPTKNYGFYIPTAAAAGGLAGLATTTLANDTIVLPQPVAISQLYSAGDTAPWLVTLYIQVPSSPAQHIFRTRGEGPEPAYPAVPVHIYVVISVVPTRRYGHRVLPARCSGDPACSGSSPYVPALRPIVWAQGQVHGPVFFRVRVRVREK